MRERLKKTIKHFFARYKLWQIEKATGYHLKPFQRKFVLNNEPPEDLWKLDRGKGKTLIAIMWTLVWRNKPISMNEEKCQLYMWTMRRRRLVHPEELDNKHEQYKIFAIPDPDIRDHRSLDLVLWKYNELAEQCRKEGIKVYKLRT